MNEPIRGIAARAQIMGAENIPRVGFGQTELTRRVGNGMITEVIEPAFQLSCGCIVQEPYSVAGVCPWCRLEIDEQSFQIVDPAQSNSSELDWLARPCIGHWHNCSYAFCGTGGCSRHIALAPDGLYYCAEHFNEVVEELNRASFEAEHGALPAIAYYLFSSLFKF